MSKINNDILIVQPKAEYKESADRLLAIPIELNGDRKELIESDRSRNVNSYDVSVTERNESNIFRLGGKLSFLFDNSLQGTTNYENYKNFMYLTNPVEVLTANDILFDNNGVRVRDTFGIKWDGYPQYDEFNFIRYDFDNPQFIFDNNEPRFKYEPRSASTYNWSTYLSYVYSSDTAQTMSYINTQINGNPVNFKASDGIPFTILNTVANGVNYITFRCGGNHNLTPAQFVELSINYDGNNLFQVETIGESGYDNTETSFSILNYGFTGSTFNDGVSGTFKRIADINNSAETKSIYYVRLHELLTDDSGVIINKMAFENAPFSKNEKVEYSALTPNLVQRISTLNGTQTYSFTVVKDVDVTDLVTNFNKPVTSVFLTIINKGYTGWFNKPSPITNTAIQYGWDFNFQENSIDNWWSTNNLNNFENIPVNTYTRRTDSGVYQFYYNESLSKGHKLVGDFCEYNESEQLEYVVSSCNHKLTFNDTLYQIESQTTSIPEGYFYKPFYEIILRDYSNDISTEISLEPIERPKWAYFSQNENLWKWREILLPGVLEDDGNGTDYPFVNGAHYPFSDFTFRLTTPFRNINVITPVIIEPIIDNCE